VECTKLRRRRQRNFVKKHFISNQGTALQALLLWEAKTGARETKMERKDQKPQEFTGSGIGNRVCPELSFEYKKIEGEINALKSID